MEDFQHLESLWDTSLPLKYTSTQPEPTIPVKKSHEPVEIRPGVAERQPVSSSGRSFQVNINPTMLAIRNAGIASARGRGPQSVKRSHNLPNLAVKELDHILNPSEVVYPSRVPVKGSTERTFSSEGPTVVDATASSEDGLSSTHRLIDFPSPKSSSCSANDDLPDEEFGVQDSIHEPTDREKIPVPACPPRQVGIARVRVELVSLNKLDELYDSGADEEPADADSDGQQRDDTNTGSNGGGGNTHSGEPSGLSRNNNQGFSGSGKRRDREDKSDGHGRKRRRQNSPETRNSLPRFACPYQAYEPSQDCLQRGPRNPRGGCDGIYRLKQHLNRRHMLSFRCQICWRSFDTKAKQMEHVQTQPPNCRHRLRPEGDRFMDVEHEIETDEICGNPMSGEEEIWWDLFRLLIPDMDTRDLTWLKTLYFPYYIATDLSLIIPSLNFTDLAFSQLELDDANQGEGASSFSDIFGGVPQPPQSDFSSHIPAPAQSGHHPVMLSQTLSVPVYEAASQPPHVIPFFQTSDYITDNSITAETPITSSGPTTRTCSSNSLSAPSLSSITTPSTGARSTIIAANTITQLRSNNERLKARNQRAQGENTELRNANRAARADITTADAVLEELLNDSSGLASGDPATANVVYDSLLNISKLLETASEKLRKAS